MSRIIIILTLTLWAYTTTFAQCYADRHTTNAFDGWVSCDKSVHEDHIQRGPTHWIEYDFGSTYSLHDIVFWNLNHPKYIDDGIKNLMVEYSIDGNNWTLHDTVSIPRGPASGFYEGHLGPDLEGVQARYLLLTTVDNYGGGCYGLSEIKVFTTDQEEQIFNLDIALCEGDGLLKNIQSGMEKNGSFSGISVVDNHNETFDFDASVAGPGIHEITYSYAGGSQTALITVYSCDDPLCASCPDCGKYNTAMVNANPIPADIYHDANLSSTGHVGTDQPVNFRGKNEINLNPGFEVNTNTDFLAEIRECEVNFIDNPGYEDNGNDWSFYVNSGASASVSYVTTDPYEESKCARINVTSVSDVNWHVQLIQDGFTIESGKDYEISFYARADGQATFTFIAQMDYSPWTWEVGEEITLTNNWQKYTLPFTASQSLDGNVNGGLRIAPNCGEFTGTFYFDKFQFYER